MCEELGRYVRRCTFYDTEVWLQSSAMSICCVLEQDTLLLLSTQLNNVYQI